MKNLILISVIVLNLLSCQKSKKIEDIVVIGGGLMGSSTAWELSKYGQNVLLLEQQDSIYTFGSSLGEARISRSLGPKNDIFSYLQQTSVKETNNLIDYLNEGETRTLHSMEDIYTTTPVTYMYSTSQLNEVETLLDGQKDKYEYASNKEKAEEKFGMKIPDTTIVIREFKQYSGTLNPKILIQKLHQGIRKSGNRVNYNQQVTSLKKEDGVYEIKITDTKTGTINTILSKKVVAAAGPYNGTLVKDVAPYFSDLISPKRLFLSFLKIKSDKYDMLTSDQKDRLVSSYPVAYLNSEIFYSMIEKYDKKQRPIFKVGGHFLRTEIEDLDKVWEKELTAQEILWSKKNTSDYLNKLDLSIELSDLEYDRGYSCVYSLTESEIPYVSQAINPSKEVDSSFVLIGGMSGVGAKGSLAYGLLATDLILGNDNNSLMYQKAKSALGTQRLMNDIDNIDK
ncbi:FAD-dependent oxidoreductase [Winogradskyella alexanderae]|uniref:FAD-binding oxidoreductase n=1 Tax=Winogradskyella alexanderae TaxID=2877123 RepID=A0ABS7XV12_9FLAO|nr:FAD-dependent oxidoreductase [Winogradskyella alexanderae]MCA0133239.1 FAD-binding oxidoreductase [Winogradskyella alexanderae]